MTGQPDTSEEKINYFDPIDKSAKGVFQLREVPQHVIDSLKNDDAFWYAGKSFIKKTKENAGERDRESRKIELPSRWMSMTTLVIIVVIFIVALAWYLLQSNIISRKQTIASIEQGEAGDESIFNIDYETSIHKAINSADYRLAVRLLFLRLLRDLSAKDIIHYKPDKTNFVYLSELNSSPHYRDFFRLTRNYEYIWYGQFEIDKGTFERIKSDFESFERSLS